VTANQPAEILGSDLVEFSTNSFIVKIWLEETAHESSKPIWRGHITHVPSGKRNYFQDLNGINAFVVPFLERLGVRLNPIGQLRDRLNRWVRAHNGR
jgi:hypothetical protein